MIRKRSIITIGTDNNFQKNEADLRCPGENDQEVINEAIQSLPSEDGKIVLLPGTYNITQPIKPNKDNLEIAGTAREATIIRPSCDLNASILEDLTPTAEKPRIGLIIRDLTLDGSAMVKRDYVFNKGIYVAYLKRALIENLYVYNIGSTGIGVDFLFNSIIRNNIVEKCGYLQAQTGNSGIGIGTGGEPEEPLIIVGNHVSECGLAGILLEVQHPEKGRFLHHIVANNIVRENYQYGILMRGLKRALISTNIAIGNKKDGIRLDTYKETPPADVLIGSNLVQDNEGYGINIDSPQASDIQIFNNNLKDNKLGGVFSKARQEEVSRFDNSGDDYNRIIGSLNIRGRDIFMPDLPSSDPHSIGQLWNDDGLVKISKG